MIVGKLKSLDEISASVADYKNLLIAGCGSCVTVCLSGGDREAMALAREISSPALYRHDPPSIRLATFVRQCERDLVKAYLEVPAETDAILSLAFRPFRVYSSNCRSSRRSIQVSLGHWMNPAYGAKNVWDAATVCSLTRLGYAPSLAAQSGCSMAPAEALPKANAKSAVTWTARGTRS
jgi:ferredoxin